MGAFFDRSGGRALHRLTRLENDGQPTAHGHAGEPTPTPAAPRARGSHSHIHLRTFFRNSKASIFADMCLQETLTIHKHH